MGKLGQATVDNSKVDSVADNEREPEDFYLKNQAEAEIRMKLDSFAKELAKAKDKRSRH